MVNLNAIKGRENHWRLLKDFNCHTCIFLTREKRFLFCMAFSVNQERIFSLTLTKLFAWLVKRVVGLFYTPQEKPLQQAAFFT